MPKKVLTPEEKIEALEERIKQLELNQSKMGKMKKKKDPNAPKRPPSAYNLFVKDAMEHIKKENPDISHPEAFKMAATMWREEKERNNS